MMIKNCRFVNTKSQNLLPNKAIAFVKDYVREDIKRIDLINASGSNRKYYRIFFQNSEPLILTENSFLKENQSFFYLTETFYQEKVIVPKLLAIDRSQTFYLQEDLGDISLFDKLNQEGFSDAVFSLYQKALEALADLQIRLSQKIDYSKLYDFQQFDEKVVFNDLFYFKSFFLDRLDIAYRKAELIETFQQIAKAVSGLPKRFFLYRDFQSRNIMIYHDKTYFIDYQGGMKGFVGYDVVSLLYQAKAQLPNIWREKLQNTYFEAFLSKNILTKNELIEGLVLSKILRFFQVLGTYGLRGLVERKTHFLDSILFSLKNLALLLEEDLMKDYPYLEQITSELSSSKTEQKIKELIKA